MATASSPWRIAILLLAAGALVATPAAARKVDRKAISEAVEAPGRPDSAVKLDEGRKPTQVLEFMGLAPGMVAADLISGTGYWAELMGRIVGPKGKVTAFEPEQFYADAAGQAGWRELAARQPNVTLVRYPFEAFAAPQATFDAAIIHLSYHDLYWESARYGIPRTDPAAFVRALHAAMKPEGVVVVIDHVGPPGDTRAVVEALHRIDPATVKADFEAAGFSLAGQTPILANKADTHDKSVFESGIRGRTDRFVFRFVKKK